MFIPLKRYFHFLQSSCIKHHHTLNRTLSSLTVETVAEDWVWVRCCINRKSAPRSPPGPRAQAKQVLLLPARLQQSEVRPHGARPPWGRPRRVEVLQGRRGCARALGGDDKRVTRAKRDSGAGQGRARQGGLSPGVELRAYHGTAGTARPRSARGRPAGSGGISAYRERSTLRPRASQDDSHGCGPRRGSGAGGECRAPRTRPPPRTGTSRAPALPFLRALPAARRRAYFPSSSKSWYSSVNRVQVVVEAILGPGCPAGAVPGRAVPGPARCPRPRVAGRGECAGRG